MTPTGFEVTVTFPFKLRVLPNMHVGKWEKAGVVADTREVVGLELLARALEFRRAWRVMESNPLLRLRVLQERTGPQKLDDDNLTGSFKPVRDEVARFFGIDDGRTDRWVWLPCTQRIGDYQVRIYLSVVKVEAEPALECCGVPLEPGVGKYGCPNCNGEKCGRTLAKVSGQTRKVAKLKKFKPTPNVRKPR